jgi:hypothetical protein
MDVRGGGKSSGREFYGYSFGQNLLADRLLHHQHPGVSRPHSLGRPRTHQVSFLSALYSKKNTIFKV